MGAWRIGVGVALGALAPAAGWANVPSAYLACAGAEPGEACVRVGPEHGACVLDTMCIPDSSLAVNNCLLCVDPCWGQPPNTVCARRDGTPGVCERQARCTEDPSKSFTECNRCVEGEPTEEQPGRAPEDGGCAAVQTPLGPLRWPVALPWVALGLLGWRQRRRG